MYDNRLKVKKLNTYLINLAGLLEALSLYLETKNPSRRWQIYRVFILRSACCAG